MLVAWRCYTPGMTCRLKSVLDSHGWMKAVNHPYLRLVIEGNCTATYGDIASISSRRRMLSHWLIEMAFGESPDGNNFECEIMWDMLVPAFQRVWPKSFPSWFGNNIFKGSLVWQLPSYGRSSWLAFTPPCQPHHHINHISMSTTSHYQPHQHQHHHHHHQQAVGKCNRSVWIHGCKHSRAWNPAFFQVMWLLGSPK